MMKQPPISANQVAARRAISNLVDSARNWRDLPDEFVHDLELWANDWPHRPNPVYEESVRGFYWIPIRPYSVSELAKQPGMPGRTRLHEVLNSLRLEKHSMRNTSGKLTPAVVAMILDRLQEPRSKGGIDK